MALLPFLLVCVFLVLAIHLVSEKKRKKRRNSDYQPIPGPIKYPLVGCLPTIMKYSSLREFAQDMCATYGKIVSIDVGPFKLVALTDYDTIMEAFKHKNIQGRPRIPSFTARGEETDSFYGITSNEGEPCREQKKFTFKHFKDVTNGKDTMVTEATDSVMRYLKNHVNKPLDSKSIFELAVYKVILKALTGIQIELEDPELQSSYRAHTNGDEILFTSNLMAPYHIFPVVSTWFPRLSGLKEIQTSFRTAYEKVQKVIDEHRGPGRDPENPRDFIDVYLNRIEETTDPHSGFFQNIGDKNLKATVLDLFGATTGSLKPTFSYMFLILGHHVHVKRRLQEEIDRVIGRDRNPDLRDRPNMPYVEATITEILRKHSIGHIGAPHLVTEDTEFRGHLLTKGTSVIPWVYGVHHDKAIWGEDPHEFRPERFLISKPISKFNNTEKIGTQQRSGQVKTDENQNEIQPNSKETTNSSSVTFDRQLNKFVIPFGCGLRVCFGETLARKILFMYLTSILQQFDFSLHSEKGESPPDPRDLTERFLLLPPNFQIVFNYRQ